MSLLMAGAIIGGSILSGVMGGNATKSAAKTAATAQTQASQLSIDESRRQFDKLQEVLNPYVQAGNTALTQQMAMIGLSGAEDQNAAIAALEGSPQFEALVRQGEEGILQNASATGGLRGGNTQAALSQFRPNVLSQLIESQYSKLGSLTNMGQASAAGVGSGALNTGGMVSNALTSAGTAQAQSALAQGQATANQWGNVAGGIGAGAGYYQQQQQLNAYNDRTKALNGAGGTL
jgi:hypothetical protein